MSRIDPLAPPPPNQKPPEVRWIDSPWVRGMLWSVLGATIAVLCPFVPFAPLKAVCVAVAGVVASAPAPHAPPPAPVGWAPDAG